MSKQPADEPGSRPDKWHQDCLPGLPAEPQKDPQGRRLSWHLARRTLVGAWTDRVPGLAAEAAFWALLSLTPLLLVLIGALGYLTPLLGAATMAQIENRIVTAAGQVLTPSAVDSLLQPVLDAVLGQGQLGIVSIGFLLALWSGSTAINTYVNAIIIAYGMRDVRSAIRSRLLTFCLYLGGLLIGTLALPLLIAAPEWVIALSPPAARPVVAPLVHYGSWPLLVLLCTGALAVLYHLAVPARTPWRRNLPGAILGMVLWLAGSLLLRTYLSFAVAHSPVYAALSAPVATLLFLYITALAVLLGAELNCHIDQLDPTPSIEAARHKAAGIELDRIQEGL